MARTAPPDRFARLVEAAARTFVRRGYRLTQMGDVARALGVAKGTLYGSVASKEGLFDAAVRYADGLVPLPDPSTLPLPAPEPGATLHYVRERVAVGAGESVLVAVAMGSVTFDSPREELKTILDDLFGRMAENRFAIKLIDRCSPELPELAAIWFGQGRWAQHELMVDLVRRRMAEGAHRKVDGVEIVARTLLENIAFWAVHHHFDASRQEVEEADVRRVIVDLLCRSLLNETA